MKKFFFVGFVIALLLIPAIAFADMSAPVTIKYEAYVSNPNGAEYFTKNDSKKEVKGSVPFKTKIICYGYGFENNDVYFFLEGEDYREVDYKMISKQDITINDLTDYHLGEKTKSRVFGETTIYDMPINILNPDEHVVGTIPDETDITVQVYQGGGLDGLGELDWSNWYYTSYNGVNGWIDDDNLTRIESTDSVLYQSIKTENGTIVPMYTPIKEYYHFRGEQYYKGIMYYNGEKVDLNIESDFADPVSPDSIDEYTYTVLFDGMELYGDNGETLVSDLPVGTVLIPEYVVWSHGPLTAIGTSYNGVRGWFYIGGHLEIFKTFEDCEREFKRNKEEKDSGSWYYSENQPTNMEELKNLYFGNKKAYDEDNKETTENDINDTTEPETQIIISGEEEAVLSENVENNQDENVQMPIKAEKSDNNVWLVVAISLVIVLVVLVIILLINRKYKK